MVTEYRREILQLDVLENLNEEEEDDDDDESRKVKCTEATAILYEKYDPLSTKNPLRVRISTKNLSDKKGGGNFVTWGWRLIRKSRGQRKTSMAIYLRWCSTCDINPGE